MVIYKMKDYEAMSRKAASILAAQITLKPDSVLGLATGSSPEGMYRQLVAWCKSGDLDFSQVTSVNLDEYKGLAPDNTQSYRYFMNHHLFDHVNIDKARTFVPDGLMTDAEAGCHAYDEIIEQTGGVDLQVLGMGINGHIGFNEPGAHFEKGTHCVDLTESTIEANKRFFEKKEDVPRQAYSMGIQTIMKARKILMLVSGEAKAQALRDAVCGKITPEMPASILQLHRDVTIVADEAACSLLND